MVALFDVTVVLTSSSSILFEGEQNFDGNIKLVKWAGYRFGVSLLIIDGCPSNPLAAPVCHACLSVGAVGNMVSATFFIFTVCPTVKYY